MTRNHGLAICALGVLAAPPAAQRSSDAVLPPRSIVTTHPLHGLVGRVDPPPRLPLWSFLDLARDDTRAESLGPEETSTVFESDLVVELLRMALRGTVDMDEVEPEYLEGGELLLVAGGREGRLVIEAAKSLERSLARGIVVDARLYDWRGRAAPPVVATAAELAALTDGLAPLWAATTRTRSGVPAALGQHEVVRYVRRANTEVAEDAKIGLPVVGQAFAGIGLTVVPHRLVATDDLAVYCQLAVGEVLGEGGQHARLQDQPTLDAPRLAVDAATMSARIRSGGALLYSVASPVELGSSLLLAVRCASAAPAGAAPPALRAWPVSAMTSGAFRSAPVWNYDGDDEDSRAPVLRRCLEEEETPWVDIDKLVDLVRSTISPETWDDKAEIIPAVGWIMVRAGPNVVDATEKLLLQLQNRWLRTTEVELISTAVQAQGAGPFARVAAGGETIALHRVRFPALVGCTQLVVHGVETTAVRGVEAEIAQQSAIARPCVESVFTGVYAEVRPYRVHGGAGVAARAAVDLVQRQSVARRVLKTAYGGALDLAALGVARFRHDGPLPVGDPLSMGFGPVVRLGDETYRARQAVRVTPR